jgi:hypothetical protein
LTPDATPGQNPRVGYPAGYLGGVFVDPVAANSTNGSCRSFCSQTSAPLIASVKTADQLGRARPSMTQHVYITGGDDLFFDHSRRVFLFGVLQGRRRVRPGRFRRYHPQQLLARVKCTPTAPI